MWREGQLIQQYERHKDSGTTRKLRPLFTLPRHPDIFCRVCRDPLDRHSLNEVQWSGFQLEAARSQYFASLRERGWRQNQHGQWYRVRRVAVLYQQPSKSDVAVSIQLRRIPTLSSTTMMSCLLPHRLVSILFLNWSILMIVFLLRHCRKALRPEIQTDSQWVFVALLRKHISTAQLSLAPPHSRKLNLESGLRLGAGLSTEWSLDPNASRLDRGLDSLFLRAIMFLLSSNDVNSKISLGSLRG